MDNTSPPRSATPTATAARRHSAPLWNEATIVPLGGGRQDTNEFWRGTDGDANAVESSESTTWTKGIAADLCPQSTRTGKKERT